MAQLNPNFEIDFNDINSYEQIQLIQDTQLAKENLLMHKAYKEPAEDEIIRNQFSSFTFVDFCPKLFTIGGQQRQSASSPNSPTNEQDEQRRSAGSRLLRHQNYELETFSDLFDRINAWLRLNKDWRVVSMETLVFDCTSQFNHLKSSIRASVLPRNMRGLRLYLSPSKSRFAGPQKIGCINVIPRKLTGQYRAGLASNSDNSNEPLSYETLDQILHRLNELLLTRPIEGRILSVETITLPIVNGYVNTETNYFMDSRLLLLEQDIYTHTNMAGPSETQPADAHGLADVLRVYYEFGPLVCGLVNLLDFLPHFHRQGARNSSQSNSEPAAASATAASDEQKPMEIDASETLTRLVRRSLAWFEEERKLVLHQTSAGQDILATGRRGRRRRQPAVNLKLCNLQIVGKILLKSQLAAVRAENAYELIQTRRMFHQKPREPIVCQPCDLSSTDLQVDWCAHLHELNQPYKLKFVRLAYVVPVFNKQLASRLAALQRPQANPSLEPTDSDDGQADDDDDDDGDEDEEEDENEDEVEQTDEMRAAAADWSSPESISQAEAPDEQLTPEEEERDLEEQSSDSSSSSSSGQIDELADDLHVLEGLLEAGCEPDLACEASLALVSETNARQLAHQLAHQLGDEADELQPADGPSSGQLIGQLTYRLFAPCQLVNSSSCFSINPVNSSSPLSRRGSVNLNAASSLSSENATPSALLLPSTQQQQQQQQQHQQQQQLHLQTANSLGDSSASINQLTGGQSQAVLASAMGAPAFSQQQVISFGAFFPALSHDIIASTSAPFQLMAGAGDNSAKPTTGAFTTNEFEPVDAIRRRMEIYVTTNSMKVLAGETLVVGLSDQLSCLSTAIEQTIVRLSLTTTAPPSTWVSVYILYAAVDEPHLPSQLLEQQRLRDRLELIQESDESACQQNDADSRADQSHGDHKELAQAATGGADNLMPVFDDDFKSAEPVVKLASRAERVSISEPPPPMSAPTPTPTSTPMPMSPTPGRPLYNSAYDRTVALPTQPDDHLGNYLEPVDFKLNPQQLADRLGFEHDREAVELFYGRTGGCQHKPLSLTCVSVQAAQRQMRLRLRQRQTGAAIVGGNRQVRLVKPAGGKGKRRHGRADGAHHHCSLI